MGGLKTKGRGPDKKKRKPRKGTKPKPKTETETVKPNIIRNIINAVSGRVKKEKREPWSLDIGPRIEVPVLGLHVFKDDSVVEIDLDKL